MNERTPSLGNGFKCRASLENESERDESEVEMKVEVSRVAVLRRFATG